MAARRRARTGTRRATTRKSTSRKSVRGTLADASATTRKEIATGLRRVFEEHGFDARLVQLQFKPAATPRQRRITAGRTGKMSAAAAARPAVAPCPPGTVRRVVCVFRKGTLICEERCVPA